MSAQGTSRCADLALLQSFIDVLPDPCVAIDSSGVVIAANAAWHELPMQNAVTFDLAGHPVGTSYFALCRSTSTEEGLHEVRSGIESVLNGESRQFEREYIYPTSAAIRWYRKIVRPWQQFGAHALVFHREISSEKLERLPRHSLEQEFQALADSAPVLIWMSGPDKGCTFFNRQWLEFTGVQIEEQLGQGWLQLVHPEDRDRVLRDYQASFDQGREFEFEYRLRHNEGSYRWIRDRGLPRIDSQRRVFGFVGSAWDLSDQKQAMEVVDRATRFTQLINSVAEIATTSTTLREALKRSVDSICVTMRFPAGHALLIEDDEPELAKPAHIVFVEDKQRFATLFEISARLSWPAGVGTPGEVLKSGKLVAHDMSSQYRDPQRYPRTAACLEAGLRAAVVLPVLVDGKVEAILEFVSDYPLAADQELIGTLEACCERVSRFFERRRAQIKFQKQKEELEASAEKLFEVAGQLVDSQEEERRRIASEIHDDFTQRLALVTMKITSLAGRGRDSAATELDADLEEVRKSIAAVAGDLRDLSHQLHPAALEILGLVRALRARCEEFQRARGVETTFEATVSDEDTSPHTALCLYRVLQEVLMNIAKHAGNARARVTLARRADHVEMRIQDDGPGFLPQEISGKGLGLKSIEERVKLLGGRVRVNSRPGSGTEIEVRVPAQAGVRQEQPQN